MSLSLSTFRTVILPYVHDAPDIAADIAARFAIREFCVKTDWLQYEHPAIDVVAGTGEYTLTPPYQSQIVRIMEAAYNGVRLEITTQDKMRSQFLDWRTQSGTPRYITSVSWPKVRLVPVPDTSLSGGLTLICAIEPVVDATLIDDTLYAKWSEVIGFGARARLKQMTGQPYYDPAGAIQDRATFLRGVSEAIVERQRGLGRPIQTVRMRVW